MASKDMVNKEDQKARISEDSVRKAAIIIKQVKDEVNKLYVSKDHVVDRIINAFLCQGHILLEGNPGLGKTVLARSFAQASSCDFSRVQFTTDLLPSDIVGLIAYNQAKASFYTVKGPIFTNILLADEINRAPSKTQSAMLEAMQEKKVTLGNTTYDLDSPFMVIATQNPIEQYGTYNLPEAELDRFLFKVNLTYPPKEDEVKILETNISTKQFDSFKIQPVFKKKDVLYLQQAVHNIYATQQVKEYIVSIADAIRNPANYSLKHAEFIRMGISPRACIGMYISSKANALMEGKTFVTPQNVKNIAHDIIHHRLYLTYDAEPEGITKKMVIEDLLAKVKIK